MRIAFDIDDTITRCPRFFSAISKALRAAGNSVFIISYRADREFAKEDLAEHDIAFDELVLPGSEDLYHHGGDWKVAAAKWKARMCREHGIDIIFEDEPVVVNELACHAIVLMPVDAQHGLLSYTAATKT